eukprot:TRINITY_DN809_c0_g1_i9.p1 TRINITY_DN809_c0_g1~~TRINITY_DN809_c0_g1_i9.p1  ORF type:complete len:693 (+),score=141.47 TRINITY_DN809_c0_g1_i9:136-2214(+)
MIRRPPRSTLSSSSAASDVYKRQVSTQSTGSRRRAMPRVRVVTRFRPLVPTEDPSKPCPLTVDDMKNEIHDVHKKEALCNFDQVLGTESSQDQVFDCTSAQMIDGVIEGYNAALFAYGQSGGGKTYSMVGGDQQKMTGDLRGIIPRTVDLLFNKLGSLQDGVTGFGVECSLFEIQGQDGKIHDLLTLDLETDQPRCLPGREDRHIEELNWIQCGSAAQMIQALSVGSSRRKVAASRQNPMSSRSHMIVTLRVSTTRQSPINGICSSQMVSSLYLVDLQGSEKMVDPDDPYHQHTAGINSALLELGKVLRLLGGDDKMTRDTAMYRGSTLTWVLREVLGGRSGAQMCMLLTCSPHEDQYYASANTLAFGEACTRVRRSPVQSEKTYDVTQLHELVGSLRAQLTRKDRCIAELRRWHEEAPALCAEAPDDGLRMECSQHQQTIQQLHGELAQAAQFHVRLEEQVRRAEQQAASQREAEACKDQARSAALQADLCRSDAQVKDLKIQLATANNRILDLEVEAERRGEQAAQLQIEAAKSEALVAADAAEKIAVLESRLCEEMSRNQEAWTEVHRLAQLLEATQNKSQELPPVPAVVAAANLQCDKDDEECRRPSSSMESYGSFESWSVSAGSRCSFESRSLSESLEEGWDAGSPAGAILREPPPGSAPLVQPSKSPGRRCSTSLQEHFMFDDGVN